MPPIELITRAVIKKDDKILLAHRIGESNTFLPGGHIEPGEYSEEALARELREELGLYASVGGFIGMLEHKFTDRHGKRYEEINIIFEVIIEEEHPSSKEGHLEFTWSHPREFNDRNLLPSTLPALLVEWKKTGIPFHKKQED